MKTDSKILAVPLPGGLLGAGAGALVAGFQFHSGAAALPVLQPLGIALMTGSIILRIALSQRGLSLADYGGLLLNGACVFISGLASVAVLAWSLQAESTPSVVGVIGPMALALLLGVGVTAIAAFLVVRLRRKSPSGSSRG